MHCLLRCSYDGTDYAGFAKSPPSRTIQESFEEVLIRLFGVEFATSQKIAGASRTDKGVHALDQCVCFHVPDVIDVQNIKRIFNQHLPTSIRVNSVSQVSATFNLHRNIHYKAYIYLIYHSPELSPFLARYVWHDKRSYDAASWNAIFDLMQGERDFISFAKEPKRYPSTICNVESMRAFSLNDIPATALYFRADRFLYNMVRRIAGFSQLLLHHQASLPSTYEQLLERYASWTTQRAPAKGLYLYRTFLKDSR
jgi:tRNA pseudouridine38-40 synthase